MVSRLTSEKKQESRGVRMKQIPDVRHFLSVFIEISRLIFGLCIVLVVFDLVPLTFNGFGVDSAGKLYVGRGHHIEVWEDGTQINNIRKGTSRGYTFTILEDDTILLASGNSVMIMDLDGKTALKRWEESHKETYNELSNKRVFSAVTGVQYHVDRIYGRLTIMQGETMIYQESLWDCFFTWLSLISFPCFVASCLIANVTKQRNDPNYYPGSRFKF